MITRNLMAGVALAAILSTPAAANGGRDLVFVFDLSDSAPVAVDQAIATQAGNYLETRIMTLEPGDSVKLRSFGQNGVAGTQIHMNVEITKRNRAVRIAPQLGEAVRSLPAMVKAGKITVESRTQLTGFLEAFGAGLDCQARPTDIVILSDGIEWTDQYQTDDLLSGKPLPAPSGDILAGCHIEFRGLGQLQSGMQTDPRWFPALKTVWSQYLQAAGAAGIELRAFFTD